LTVARKPRFIDTANSSMNIRCPRCGLRTARFMEFCQNCYYSLWPNPDVASAAFQAWRDADPGRRLARRYDQFLRSAEAAPAEFDYDSRAHELGIHISPPSNWPFVIAVGMMLGFLALAPVPLPVRIALLVIGLVTLAVGIVGWAVVDDTRNFPRADASPDRHGHAGGADGEEAKQVAHAGGHPSEHDGGHGGGRGGAGG
jgi:hypothetical protein